jgi:NADH-quinone oxidoreductase subunit G
MTGAVLGSLSDGSNSAGAHLAGLLPHRSQGGQPRGEAGLHAGALLDEALDAIMLVNIEPDADLLATSGAVEKLARQKFVVALTPFVSDALLEAADLLLPIGTFAETSGTFINVSGTWQSFAGVAAPVGEARPAWKVLRVLGNLLDIPDFDYVTSEEVRDEVRSQLGDLTPDNSYAGQTALAMASGDDSPAAEIDIPIYSVDGLVRRASALQLTVEARLAASKAADS